MTHTRCRAQCRQKGCECGYYNLRHNLNNSILLHNSSLFTFHYSLFTRKEPLSELFLGFVASGAAATFVVIVASGVVTTIRGTSLVVAAGIRGSVAALTA